MRVGINATAFNSLPSGAKQRFVGLFAELFKDPTHEYVVFESRDTSLAGNFNAANRPSFVRTPLPSNRTTQRVLLSKLYWPFALPRRAIDVFDTSGVSWVRHRTGATFHTLHDIRHVTHPNLYPFRYRMVGTRETRATLVNADVVITVSDAMKMQLLEFEPKARVSVLPNAIDWDERAEGERIIAGPYLLAVGHIERRKNYLRLVDAFETVANSGYDGSLFIVGNPLDETSILQERISRSPLRSRIQVRSGVPRSDLVRYYRDADLFVFPSLYEGFGIPILEAMNFGCPFVLSDLAVFREIAGDDAAYFQPTDVKDMADVISAALSSPTWRASCHAITERRRRVYSWTAVAKAYLNLLAAVS